MLFSRASIQNRMKLASRGGRKRFLPNEISESYFAAAYAGSVKNNPPLLCPTTDGTKKVGVSFYESVLLQTGIICSSAILRCCHLLEGEARLIS